MNKLIATIPKTPLDEIRVEISEYNGHDFVSIRTWNEKSDSRERVPTPSHQSS